MSGKYLTTDPEIQSRLAQVRHIALIGISLKPDRPSYRVLSFLRNEGFQVSALNPGLAGQEILGQRIFASLQDVADPIDMIDVFRQPSALDEIIDAAHAARVPLIWTQLGVVNKDATDRALTLGIDVIEDRCPKQEIPRWRAAGQWPA